MSKTTTVNQYAALAKRKGGSWYKLHSFELKSKEMAEKYIAEHKNRFAPPTYPCEYKIMQRTVTITMEDWRDL